jgi:hypothetical protein
MVFLSHKSIVLERTCEEINIFSDSNHEGDGEREK